MLANERNFLRPITTKGNSTLHKMKLLLIFRIIKNRFLTFCSIEKLFKETTTAMWRAEPTVQVAISLFQSVWPNHSGEEGQVCKRLTILLHTPGQRERADKEDNNLQFQLKMIFSLFLSSQPVHEAQTKSQNKRLVEDCTEKLKRNKKNNSHLNNVKGLRSLIQFKK